MTNTAIIEHIGRNARRDKLTPFSGPQCNEDRGNETLYNYNPDMRFKLGHTDMNVPSAEWNGQELAETNPVECSDMLEDNIQNVCDYADVFKNCSFRVCGKCKKTRILDSRATLKYPLGSYRYGGKWSE